MDPPTLVPGGNTTRYLCLAFGIGWCYHPVPKGAPRVTSNRKVNGGRYANVSRTVRGQFLVFSILDVKVNGGRSANVSWMVRAQFFSDIRKLNADSSDVLKS